MPNYLNLENLNKYMAKDTLWFPHDYNARADEKTAALIGEYGALGYGVFQIITEILHEEDGSKIEYSEKKIRRLAGICKVKYDELKAIIDDCINVFDLWITDGEYFYSERVKRNKEDRERIRSKRMEAGKRGGEANASKIKANASKKVANGKQNVANSSTGQDITVIPSKEAITSSLEEDINISADLQKKYSKNEWFGWKVAKEIITKKEAFTEKIKPFVADYGATLCNDFWYYWTQPMTNRSGKLAYEAEKKFDIDARLRTFKTNSNRKK